MKRHLNSFKNTFLIIIGRFDKFRPIPAAIHIEKLRKNRENSQKIAKNAIFQNLKIFDIVAGNMIFGRKLTLWTPESPQKAYIDHPTHYGAILRKIKKIRFLTSKIQKKSFFRPIIPADVTRPSKQYWGSKHHISAPKAL